jgi:hypothetical protein
VRITTTARGYLLATTGLLLACPAAAGAQSIVGTISGGPASVKTLSTHDFAWLIGGGAERRRKSFGLGGEIDYVHFPRMTRPREEPPLNMAALTVKGSHYFGAHSTGRARPFLSGGLSFLVGEGQYGMILLAGGVDVWTSSRAGIRLETRAQFPILFSVRCGIVFR